MTPDVTRSNSSQVTKLPIKRNRHSPKNSSINLPRLPKQHAKENKTSTVQRRKDFILTDKYASRILSTPKILLITFREKVDFLSWSFMKDLTSNLVNTSMLSDTFAVQLCDKVIQKWATNLSQSRLFMLTGKILLETGIGIDGLLSKFDPQFVDRMTHTDSEDKDVDNDEHENEVDPPGNHVAETSNDSEIHENYDENQSQYEDDHTDDQVESQHSTFREPNPKIEESRQKERKRWSTSVQNEQCLKGKVRGANFDEELREESVQVKEDILNQDQDYCVVGSTSSSYKGRSSEKSKRVALATVGRMLDDLILDDKI
uniref:Uncharacterized protein n=1 Tax=Romanomermis culicivorax TaxID=13658 RepID=A0A915IQQ0_ROMCU